jgi:hypothetical protein
VCSSAAGGWGLAARFPAALKTPARPLSEDGSHAPRPVPILTKHQNPLPLTVCDIRV